MVPGGRIRINHVLRGDFVHLQCFIVVFLDPDLLLDRYCPIRSWLFHSRRCRASTFPSLMKDRLWFTESLGGESEAMSRKNLKGMKPRVRDVGRKQYSV